MRQLIIPAVYCHICSGKNYHVYDTIQNKTKKTLMIMYRDDNNSYVREHDDFIDKFTYVRD